MVYSLAYRRPPHVDSAQASIIGDEKTKSVGEESIDSQGSASGIPDALSFDRIIAGGTCPVSTSYLVQSMHMGGWNPYSSSVLRRVYIEA